MKRKILTALTCVLILVLSVLIVAGILYSPVQVVIDPGHGGSDVGAQYNGRYEKDDNLEIALLVHENLKKMGIESCLTRDSDKFIELEDRCAVANRRNAQLFVSLHRNSAEGANGVEIWINSDESDADRALAENILEALDGVGISENRGVKSGYARGEGNYYVNSHTDMPSCLVELGFINSETDNKLLDENMEAYAQAIAKAIEQSLTE